MRRFVCRKNGADSQVFTDGKVYEGEATGPGLRTVSIRDDWGYERIIIPGEPCPHLVVQTNRYPPTHSLYPLFRDQKVVGHFEEITP